MSVFQEFTFPSSTGKNTIHCLKCLPEGSPRAVVQICWQSRFFAMVFSPLPMHLNRAVVDFHKVN